MDHHAIEYYRSYSEEAPHGHFHRVIALHEEPMIDWQEASELAPELCRGWYELASLSTQDRIEFTRDFWIAKLPYHPTITEFLMSFFASLDDIGIFLTQKKYEDPFDVSIVYSLANDNGFFHGNPPLREEDLNQLKQAFLPYLLPIDYLAFLQIHNGFAKLNDTGILSASCLLKNYELFQKQLADQDPLMTNKGDVVNPLSLIPFYQSFDLPFFQCFWGEWYPDQEMGNVYYSGAINKIFTCTNHVECVETMAFENYIDWLVFYLEKIE